MARKIIQNYIDDIDGTPYEPDEGETVSFGLDGRTYEIDLSAKNAQGLRDTLAMYVTSGRRVKTQGAASSSRRPTSSRDTENRKAREWALSVGMPVSARGRVAANVLESYREAQSVAATV